MLLRGDFDLNSVQIYTESFKEAFKQTMLNQEIMFRKQVYELHRLYSVQKTLMNDVTYKNLDNCNPPKVGALSSLTPFLNPTKFEPLMKETTIPSVHMVSTMQPISHELLEGHLGSDCKLQEMPLDLQLPADQYISHVDNNLFSKRDVWHRLEQKKELWDSHSSGHFQDKLELELSLALEVGMKKQSTKRTWLDRKPQSFPHVVIDLEEPTERISNKDKEHAASIGCAAPFTCFGGKHEEPISILSDASISKIVKKDPSPGTRECSSLVDDSACCQKPDSFKQALSAGFKNGKDDVAVNNLSAWKQQFVSYEQGGVDLNKVQLDDLSFHSNDLMVANPSTVSSPGGFTGLVGQVQHDICPPMVCKEDINGCFNGSSDTLQQDEAVLMNLSGKDQLTERNTKLNSEAEVKHMVLGSPSWDSKNGKDDSIWTFKDNGQMSCERSEVEDAMLVCSDQSQNIQQKDGCRSPASCKSSSITDNDSTSLKTMQSGIESENSSLHLSCQFSGTQVGSQVTETLSGEPDQRSSSSIERRHECYNKKEDPGEVDLLIQSAAQSLIHISLDTSAGNQELSTQAGSNEMGSEEMEQPQCSSDSYELITLNLTETNADEYCVSSKPLEVNNTEKKDLSFKLRRGRRLKDFQRDILPGLASLSRHEIREDINIMEGVLRSREYKKLRARLGDTESWCAPVRSRRSRLNHVGRRKF